MKFTDLDKTLVTEAPEAFDKTQGRLSRAATKIKKKIGPTKKIRQRAKGKSAYQDKALTIKQEFHDWSGGLDKGTSVEDFKAFAEEEYPVLVPVIDKIAAKLKFAAKPEPGSDPKANADDSADQPVDATSGEESEDMISPDEMSGNDERESGDPTKKPAGMEQEEYDSIKAAYAKKAEEDQEESVEEDSDDAEPKVDMSASIYEARFNHMLLLERDLKDNQLDTLIVRVLQAADLPDSSSAPAQAQAQAPSKSSKPSKSKPEKAEKGSLLKRAGKAMFGDLVGGGDDEGSGSGGGSDGLDLDKADQRALRQILRKIVNDKPLSDQEKRAAQNIARQL